jgi:DNA-directed RNA polymerase specialized sigma subunit
MREDDRVMRQYAEWVRTIVSQARTQLGFDAPLEELSAVGLRSFSQARQRFDPARGCAFEVFAHYRVRAALLDRLRELARWPHRASARFTAIEALDKAAEARALAPAAIGGAESSLRALDAILGRMAEAYASAVTVQPFDQIEA